MNNFKINGTDPDIIMSKGQQVDRIYSKGTLVWEKSCDLDGIIDCYYTEPEPTYPEVTIGTQTWMAVNLDVDDGLGGIYAYDDNEGNVATYGRLYTWNAAMRVAASIDGWHLPSNTEWQTLSDYLGGDSISGRKLKEEGTTHWLPPSNGINSSSFTALPGGIYNYSDNSFLLIRNYGRWWTSTAPTTYSSYLREMRHNYSGLSSNSLNNSYGYSVRLIKD